MECPTGDEYVRAEQSLEDYLSPNRSPKAAAGVVIDVCELSDEEFDIFAHVVADDSRTIRRWLLEFLLEQAMTRENVSDTCKMRLLKRIDQK